MVFSADDGSLLIFACMQFVHRLIENKNVFQAKANHWEGGGEASSSEQV